MSNQIAQQDFVIQEHNIQLNIYDKYILYSTFVCVYVTACLPGSSHH